MKFPRYWVRGTVEVSDEKGKRHTFTGWGWSDESRGEAEKKGKAKASRLAEWILKGNRPDRYLYGDRPLREEVFEELKNRQGETYAAITRNSYGCHILNTAAIMFVDVDLPQPTSLEKLRYRVQSLLGSSALPPRQGYEAAALSKLESVIKNNPKMGARAYRTRGGLRYLFTHDLVDPKSPQVLGMMKNLAADPLYVRLCQAQESFRARLTPKPWRCGVPAPTIRWPWPSSDAEARFRQWEGGYLAGAQRYNTCRFVGGYGNKKVHPEIAAVVDLHDRRTKAAVGGELA